MTDGYSQADLARRIDELQRRLDEVAAELDELRETNAATAVSATPETPRAPASTQPPAAPPPTPPAPLPVSPAAVPPAVEAAQKWRAAGDPTGAVWVLQEALGRGENDPYALGAIADELDAIGVSVPRLSARASTLSAGARAKAGARAPAPSPPAPVVPAAPPREVAPPLAAPPAPAPPRVVEPARPAPVPHGAVVVPETLGEKLERWDVFGPRGFAIAGGIVTALGIAFFFVLAANRGWIGPSERVALGAIASALVFGTGLVLRERFGQYQAALAAVGAGIAGAYTTLVASTVIYDFLPTGAALAVAGAIAAVGAGVSLRWDSEIVAGLGLLGALAVPVLVAADDGPSADIGAFLVVLLAAIGVVGVRKGWLILTMTGAAGAALQVLWLDSETTPVDRGAVAVTAAIVAVLVAIAVGRQLADDRGELDALAGALGTGAASLALVCTFLLFTDDRDQGLALLAAAAILLAGAGVAFGARARDLAEVLGAAALALSAIGTALLASGATLSLVWAAESVAFTLVAWRLREPRFQAVSLVYLGAAALNAVTVDARPGAFADTSLPSLRDGIISAAAVTVAAACAAALTPKEYRESAPERGLLADLDAAFARLGRVRNGLVLALWGLAGLALLDAVGLALVDLDFAKGNVAASILWAVAGAAAVIAAGLLDARRLGVAGLVWLGLVLVKVAAVDLASDAISVREGSLSVLVLAAAVLVSGYAFEVAFPRERLWILSAITSGLALLLATGALSGLIGAGDMTTSDERWLGAALFVVALVYAALAANVFRRAGLRDLATVEWVLGLVALLLGEGLVIQGRASAVAFSATAVVLALLASRTGEDRLQLSAGLVAGGTTLATVVFLTPPERLVEASEHPAESLWTLLACALALGIVGALGKGPWRYGTWIAAGLAVYAVSLAILHVAERVSGASIETDFQRGHTALSAFWGLLGLALLLIGFARGVPALRFGGLALFGLSLAKLFLYDLSSLSSITRALSFLAVGALLLAGGFFLQRLGAKRDAAT